MKSAIKILVAGVLCLGVAVGVVFLAGGEDLLRALGYTPSKPAKRAEKLPIKASASGMSVPLYSDNFLDDSGYSLSTLFTGEIADRSSIEALRQANNRRTLVGLQSLRAERARLDAISPKTPQLVVQITKMDAWIASLHMSRGEFPKADEQIATALKILDRDDVPPNLKANMRAMRGVAALRRGEVENCVSCLGPSACILPIAPEAYHQFTSGSSMASREFVAYLAQRPEDLGVRWLLNLAHMTLGDYPQAVPEDYLIPQDRYKSRIDVGRFENVANAAGLHKRGPNLAGGSVFDDFDGDNFPDVFFATFDCDLGASLFLNKGDGTFAERSAGAGLSDQGVVVNATQADFDNDGHLDVLLMRGGWENPARLSLLRNKGGGKFEDVTIKAGLDRPISSQSAAWGDYDLDGFLDLYVAGESLGDSVAGLQADDKALGRGDPRNLCSLYHNNGDGTFTNMAAQAGVENDRYAKGVMFGDYNDDGFPDLLVSNLGDDERLYRNNGDGTFTDVAPDLGIGGPKLSFSCWFWDMDNDGRLDVYVSGYGGTINDYAADQLGLPTPKAERPRLYRNLGPERGFEDVTTKMNLDRVYFPMGANVGDIDEDGFLDIYLSTGRPAYSFLVPNVLLKNVAGARFEDVTSSTGTGHLQKGHGVSFADFDGDGDLDLYAELGGAIPGDQAHSALFKNPGHDRHTLQVRLVGTKANRSAIGAHVRADVTQKDGTRRSIHREINAGSSFGGNSLVCSLGLGDAAKVETLTITWPDRGRTKQVFRDVAADRLIEIAEGSETVRLIRATRQ